MRRLLIGISVLFGIGLCLALLLFWYNALPEVTRWKLNEGNLSTLTAEELTNDSWQWQPSPDRELLAIARTEYTLEKPILPQFAQPKRGYHLYFRFRVRDDLRRQLSSAVKAGNRPVSSYQKQRPDEPLPSWWHPKYSVTLSEGDKQVYFFDPAEPEIAYTTSHSEGTAP